MFRSFWKHKLLAETQVKKVNRLPKIDTVIALRQISATYINATIPFLIDSFMFFTPYEPMGTYIPFRDLIFPLSQACILINFVFCTAQLFDSP
jgi:predicted permease